MVNNDKPITKISDDELDRFKYSKSLFDYIMSYDGDECIVFGLEGSWGTGKTSIVNMGLEYINSSEFDDKKSPKIIKFNPWRFIDQNQLLIKFFDEIILAQIEDTQTAKKLFSYFNRLIVPVLTVSSILSPSRTQALLSVSKYIKEDEDEKNSLEEIKENVDNLLKEKDHKLLIIIDDIDRLSDKEIRQIFQLVKLVADFPNIIYLLVYDRKVVTNALNGTQKGMGENYLEKIVQVSLKVPKMSESDIERLFFDEINELLKNVPEKKIDKDYWNSLYYAGLKSFFTNIRALSLYFNALKFNFEILKDLINPIDLLSITVIQVFIPEVYNGIKENKEVFVGIFNTRSSSNLEKEQAKIRCDEIISRANEEFQEDLKEILLLMFPKLSSVYSNINYGNDWLSGWSRESRICSHNHFDIYFSLLIPEGEISSNEMETILGMSNNMDLLAESLLKLNEDGKIIKFLDRLENYTSILDENDIEPIVMVLMDIGDLFTQEHGGLLKPNTSMRILRIIYQLLKRIDNQDERYEILKNSIIIAERSLYIAVHEIGVQDQEHGKYDLSQTKKPEEECIVNSKQLKNLEEITLEKIELWASNGRLISHSKLGEILFMWKKWGNPNNVDDFVKTATQDDTGLINFINGFTEETSTVFFENNLEKVFWRINLEFMKEFINLDDIRSRIENISLSEEFEELDDSHKRAIQLFLDGKNSNN
ncbi:MAG: P-loop NTPase fold protein [Methanobacteriaceae archaeon]|nr:P-loop NTPase fold protein [Methanobacteriaceae archaeon]MDP2836206.1 P-loop NTPase fold protein [Methanobacteriaceae archaeon]MDP3033653.1 P-loop NTPase fold protein [Methanobacteriaceae archaeon]MDP3484695.1 P-loop NTPase fold protein [Methanobacteriaceae archaeon]MDP3624672.1 P-loop NTPase fold protein [Methanobacteriaceae archaeon]